MRPGAANIEKGECLKTWIRSGLIAGWRKEYIEAQEEDQEDQDGWVDEENEDIEEDD